MVFVVYVFMFLGVVGIIGGVWGARAAHVRIAGSKLRWWRVQLVPILCSIVLSVPLSMVPYPISDTTTMVGIPFPAAVFIEGRDYTGPATLPMFVANLLFWLLLAQLILAASLKAKARRQTSP